VWSHELGSPDPEDGPEGRGTGSRPAAPEAPTTSAGTRLARLERDLLGLRLRALGQGNPQNAIGQLGLDVLGVDRLGQADHPLEPAPRPAVVQVVPGLLLALSPDAE